MMEDESPPYDLQPVEADGAETGVNQSLDMASPVAGAEASMANMEGIDGDDGNEGVADGATNEADLMQEVEAKPGPDLTAQSQTRTVQQLQIWKETMIEDGSPPYELHPAKADGAEAGVNVSAQMVSTVPGAHPDAPMENMDDGDGDVADGASDDVSEAESPTITIQQHMLQHMQESGEPLQHAGHESSHHPVMEQADMHGAQPMDQGVPVHQSFVPMEHETYAHSVQQESAPMSEVQERVNMQQIQSHQEVQTSPDYAEGELEHQQNSNNPETEMQHQQASVYPEDEIQHRQTSGSSEAESEHQESSNYPETEIQHQQAASFAEAQLDHQQTTDYPEAEVEDEQTHDYPHGDVGHHQYSHFQAGNSEQQQASDFGEAGVEHQQSSNHTENGDEGQLSSNLEEGNYEEQQTSDYSEMTERENSGLVEGEHGQTSSIAKAESEIQHGQEFHRMEAERHEGQKFQLAEDGEHQRSYVSEAQGEDLQEGSDHSTLGGAIGAVSEDASLPVSSTAPHPVVNTAGVGVGDSNTTAGSVNGDNDVKNEQQSQLSMHYVTQPSGSMEGCQPSEETDANHGDLSSALPEQTQPSERANVVGITNEENSIPQMRPELDPQPQLQQQQEELSEPQLKTEPESESKPEPGCGPGTTPESEPEPEPDFEPEFEPETEPERGPEPESGPEHVPEHETLTKAEPDNGPGPEPELEARLEFAHGESEAEPEPEPELESAQGEPETGPESETALVVPKPDPAPEIPQEELEPEPDPKPKHETGEPEGDPEAEQAQPEPEPEAEAEAESESEAESEAEGEPVQGELITVTVDPTRSLGLKAKNVDEDRSSKATSPVKLPHWVIHFVKPDSQASSQGIVVGSIIRSVGGTKMVTAKTNLGSVVNNEKRKALAAMAENGQGEEEAQPKLTLVIELPPRCKLGKKRTRAGEDTEPSRANSGVAKSSGAPERPQSFMAAITRNGNLPTPRLGGANGIVQAAATEMASSPVEVGHSTPTESSNQDAEKIIASLTSSASSKRRFSQLQDNDKSSENHENHASPSSNSHEFLIQPFDRFQLPPAPAKSTIPACPDKGDEHGGVGSFSLSSSKLTKFIERRVENICRDFCLCPPHSHVTEQLISLLVLSSLRYDGPSADLARTISFSCQVEDVCATEHPSYIIRKYSKGPQPWIATREYIVDKAVEMVKEDRNATWLKRERINILGDIYCKEIKQHLVSWRPYLCRDDQANLLNLYATTIWEKFSSTRKDKVTFVRELTERYVYESAKELESSGKCPEVNPTGADAQSGAALSPPEVMRIVKKHLRLLLPEVLPLLGEMELTDVAHAATEELCKRYITLKKRHVTVEAVHDILDDMEDETGFLRKVNGLTVLGFKLSAFPELGQGSLAVDGSVAAVASAASVASLLKIEGAPYRRSISQASASGGGVVGRKSDAISEGYDTTASSDYGARKAARQNTSPSKRKGRPKSATASKHEKLIRSAGWKLSTEKKVDARVYAEFSNGQYYWGVITKVKEADKPNARRFKVRFEDGDMLGNIRPTKIYTEVQYVELMGEKPPRPQTDSDESEVDYEDDDDDDEIDDNLEDDGESSDEEQRKPETERSKKGNRGKKRKRSSTNNTDECDRIQKAPGDNEESERNQFHPSSGREDTRSKKASAGEESPSENDSSDDGLEDEMSKFMNKESSQLQQGGTLKSVEGSSSAVRRSSASSSGDGSGPSLSRGSLEGGARSMLRKSSSTLSASSSNEKVEPLTMRELANLACNNCSRCRLKECGHCFSCKKNVDLQNGSTKELCVRKMCLRIDPKKKAQPAVGFPPGWTFLFDHVKTSNFRSVHQHDAVMQGIKIISNRRKYFRSFEVAARWRGVDYDSATTIFLKHIGVVQVEKDHVLVGKGCRREWMNINGQRKVLYGEIIKCFEDWCDGGKDEYFTVQNNKESLSLNMEDGNPTGKEISLIEELPHEAAWGCVVSYDNVVQSRKSFDCTQVGRTFPCKCWVTPEMRREEMVPSESGRSLPKLTVVLRGHKLVFSVKQSTIPNAGYGVFLKWTGCGDERLTNYDLCSCLRAGELLDVGIYAPFRPEDKKHECVFKLKNYIHALVCEDWCFGAAEEEYQYDITDEITGNVHELAQRHIPMYVNECGRDGIPSIHAELDPEGSVHYLFGISYEGDQEAYKKGVDNLNDKLMDGEVEVFVNYGEEYERIRLRKGYSDIPDEQQEHMRDKLENDEDEFVHEVDELSLKELNLCVDYFSNCFLSELKLKMRRTGKGGTRGPVTLHERVKNRVFVVLQRMNQRLMHIQQNGEAPNTGRNTPVQGRSSPQPTTPAVIVSDLIQRCKDVMDTINSYG